MIRFFTLTEQMDAAFDLAQATLFDIREMEDMGMECDFERVEYDALITYGEMAAYYLGV